MKLKIRIASRKSKLALRQVEILDLELPIMTSIKKILNKEANIDEIIKKLLSRPIKNEFI